MVSASSSPYHKPAGNLIRCAELPLPPGPKGLPLIGNMLDMPKEHEWVTFTEWKRKYGRLDTVAGFRFLTANIDQGDVVHVNVLGQDLVYLNSRDVCWDLLEKRSSIYSSRPPLRLFMDPSLCVPIWEMQSRFSKFWYIFVRMNLYWDVSLFPYGSEWRRHRKLLHHKFNINESKAYREKVEKHSMWAILLLMNQISFTTIT